MTETDKRYFIKRIKDIQKELVENIPDTPKISFDEYKSRLIEEIDKVYNNMNKTKSEQIVRNVFSRVSSKIMDSTYYGEHCYHFNHTSIGITKLIPEINTIQKKLNKLVEDRKKEEDAIAKDLRSMANEICDHIRFDDIEEHYGKSIKEVMNDFRNFYTNKKAA